MTAINLKKIGKELLQYIFFTFMLYCSGDTALGAEYPEIRNFFIMLATIYTIFYYIVMKKEISCRHAKIYMGCMTCMFLSMILNLDFSGFSMMMVMLIAMLISETVDFDDFILKYSNIIFVFAAASIIGVIIQWFWPSLLESLPILDEGGLHELKNAVITTIPRKDPYRFMRIYGIFREPSMFAIYLIIGLLAEIFYRRRKRYVSIASLGIALTLTLSMTGFIAAAILIAAYFAGKKMTKAKVFILMLAFILGSYYLTHGTIRGYGTILNYIYVRMQRSGSSAHSINSRIASITVQLFTYLTHPIAGAGAMKSQQLFDVNLSILGYPDGLTGANMIMYLLASFGIVFTGYFVRGLYWFAGRISRKKNGFMVFLVICACLCGQTMHYSVFPFLMMFYGCRQYRKRLVAVL